MTQGNRSVAELGDDIGRQLTSFVSLLDILYKIKSLCKNLDLEMLI